MKISRMLHILPTVCSWFHHYIQATYEAYRRPRIGTSISTQQSWNGSKVVEDTREMNYPATQPTLKTYQAQLDFLMIEYGLFIHVVESDDGIKKKLQPVVSKSWIPEVLREFHSVVSRDDLQCSLDITKNNGKVIMGQFKRLCEGMV